MTTLQWLLALHVTGAFLFLGGAIAAAALGLCAQRSQRPSEVALFLGLARVTVAAIGVGAVLTLVLGLWLVHDAGYSYGQSWVVASIALWFLAAAAGGAGGRRERETRQLALSLAAADDEPSRELRARLRDRGTVLLSWGSRASMVAVLALMIWKPGS